MNGDIIRLTMRQQLTLPRLALMTLLAGLPILVAGVYAISNTEGERDQAIFATDLLDSLVLLGVLPIVALLVGTGVLGNEVQEGTAPYLLLKPLSRGSIVISKLLVAVITTSLAVGVAVVVSGVVVLAGDSGEIVTAFVIACLLASAAYCAWFVLLSILTSRAFIAGLLYVFLWEGVVTFIFNGARYVSIRHYSRAIADGLANQSNDIFEADLSLAAGLIGVVVVTVAATWFAIERLKQFEVHDRSL